MVDYPTGDTSYRDMYNNSLEYGYSIYRPASFVVLLFCTKHIVARKIAVFPIDRDRAS